MGKQYRSDALAAVHETALGLAEAGVMDKRTMKAFDEMYLLTSGGPNFATTLVTQHIKTLFFDSLQFGEASAFSLVVVILTALVLGAVLFTRSKVEK